MTTRFILPVLLIATASGTSWADTSRTYDFSGFDELDISAGVEVEYAAADTDSVIAEFSLGGPDDLKLRQDGDRLYISRKMKSGWGNKVRAIIRVTSRDLNEIEASSGSSIQASGIQSEDFSLRVSSGASADLSGTCEALTVKAGSGGTADAQALKCKAVSAAASSGGSVRAYASANASSKTSSGGSVDIWGEPPQRSANHSISGGSTNFH